MRPNKGPYLAPNAHGVWEIRWTENGRSRRRSTGKRDQASAHRALATFLQERPETTPGGPGYVTVQQCLDLYWREHVQEHTRDVDRIRIALSHLGRFLGKEKAYRLNEGHARRYQRHRLNEGIGLGTIRRELSCLSTALRFAVRWDWLDKAPRIPLPTAPSGPDLWLTNQQIDVMLAWLERNQPDSRLHRFVILALGTAARRKAIEQLRFEHIEVDNIRFDRQVEVQTKKRRVPVPISDWLEPYLARWQREALAAQTGRWVLGSPRPIRGAFDWMREKLADETGDETFRKMTRHTLRHTAATLMLQSGATIWQVAGVLGDDPRTVAKTYGHHAQDHLREAVNSWREANPKMAAAWQESADNQHTTTNR